MHFSITLGNRKYEISTFRRCSLFFFHYLAVNKLIPGMIQNIYLIAVYVLEGNANY